MNELKPYLNYLKINFKTYLLVVIAVMITILLIGSGIEYFYLSSLDGASVSKATSSSYSSLFGSVSGIAVVYGIMLSIVEFNTMMNIRADRKSIMISSILFLIEFVVINSIIFMLLLKGHEYIISIISPVTLDIEKVGILEILECIMIVGVESSIGLALGAIFYRFGGIRVTIAIMIIASLVILLLGINVNYLDATLIESTISYIENLINNYELIISISFTLIMYIIYWNLMKKVPIKEYSKKKFLKIKM